MTENPDLMITLRMPYSRDLYRKLGKMLFNLTLGIILTMKFSLTKVGTRYTNQNQNHG